MPRKWEYKIITLDCIKVLPSGERSYWLGSEQEKQLNKLGGYGWELSYFHQLPDYCDCFVILKREKEQVEA